MSSFTSGWRKGETTLQPDQSTLQQKAREVIAQVGRVILGKEREIREVLLAILADGHILLNDIPGVGKTTLALAFSRALDLEYKRVQFTPDVMPSDLTGFSIYRREEERFVYQPGTVFCNLLLADEINRTSPKTQSALLEVMEERRVTVEGVTREVPSPFLVIATQNPFGAAGTQLLPEAQVDRFMISLSLGYPDYESELLMAKRIGRENPLDRISRCLKREELLRIQQTIHEVTIREEMYYYLLDLVTETRRNPHLERGASPRATAALVKLAKASAWFSGRSYVTPADIRGQFPYVVSHRMLLSSEARLGHAKGADLIAAILEETKEPPMGKENP